jgi:hypothetical protein
LRVSRKGGPREGVVTSQGIKRPRVDLPPPPGCNTDALLDGLDRYDDCHVGDVGAEKVTQAWADILLAEKTQITGSIPAAKSLVP